MTRILLIEDDDLLAEGLLFALEKEAFAADRARSLEEARRLLSGGPYDMLLLDVMLPDGNGFGLCREVRASGLATPILFLTACDEEANVVQGLELGGDDYLTKPIRLRELVSRMKAVLRRTAAAAAKTDTGEEEHTLSGGGILLRPLDGKAVKYGVERELTPVEVRLLSLLLRHPGATLPRARLLDKLWDEQGEFVDDNTLSVHIRRLREKIEEDPSRPRLIVTVRGVGYRFDPEGSLSHE